VLKKVENNNNIVQEFGKKHNERVEFSTQCRFEEAE